MSTDFLNVLKTAPRLLMEVELKPLQGERFQSTGFQKLGPGRYWLYSNEGNDTPMLLVESAQSVANRLEAVCWDEANCDLIKELEGLPYVKICVGENSEWGVTSSVLEFHRLNSPYIWESDPDSLGKEFRQSFMTAVGAGRSEKAKKNSPKQEEESEERSMVSGVIDSRKLAAAVFKFDPNSIIHGLFLTKIDGRLRLTRALSGFIEARNVREAESGGVKFDRVFPARTTVEGMELTSNDGFVNVPFHRTEFTSERTMAYFNLDLALLRGYGLRPEATDLLVAVSLFKVRRLLDNGLRLRAACDFKTVEKLRVTSPENFSVPKEVDLLSTIKKKIDECKKNKLFADPPVTLVIWKPKRKQGKKDTKKLEANSPPQEAKESGASEGANG